MSSLAFDFCYIPTGPLADTVQLAQLGESLGYRTMWIPDQDFLHDPFVLAAAAAAATDRLNIGIGITSPLTRHAAHIARAAASVAEVSGQRLRLGLGSGNINHVVRPMGLPVNRTVARVREGAASVASLLRGEPVRFAEGEEAIRLGTDPTRHIPLYLGARGPKMLALAGELADGVLAESLFHGGGLDYALAAVHRGKEQSGRRHEGFDMVSWQVLAVTDGASAELDRYRPWVARMMQAGPAEAMLRIGIAPGNLEHVVGLMGAGRFEQAAAAVSDETVRCIVLIGTPDELGDRIAHIRDRGACAVSLVSSATTEETARHLNRFAKEVMPAFREPI